MNDGFKPAAAHCDSGENPFQERMEQLYRQAQVGRCVNGVAHDVNNLLGAALAYAELAMMDSDPGSELNPMLEKLIEAVEQCGRLIAALMGVARTPTYDASLVKISTIVEDVLLLREYALKDKKIDVTVDVQEDLPEVKANTQHLTTALLYIFLNCEEHIEQTPGPKRIELRVYSDQKVLFLEIKNNGPTLPNEYWEERFKPPNAENTESGMDLGLSLARRIIEQQGGSIHHHPERGFILSFPLEIF